MHSLSKSRIVLQGLLLASLIVAVRGAEGKSVDLHHEVCLTPPPGWECAAAFPSILGEDPYATLKFVAKDGHHAVMIITLLPDDLLGFRVENLATLQQFAAVAAQPYLAPGAIAPSLTEFTWQDGIGVRTTLESTPLPSRYRFTSVICALVGWKHLVHCVVFHDGPGSAEFSQAFEAILSARSIDD